MALFKKKDKNDSEAQTKNKRAITTEDRLAMCDKISFAAAEAYKRLRTNILFSFPDDYSCHIIGVTSSIKGEGKSVTAVNLAYTMAQNKKRVLLVDGDMRIPTVTKKLDFHVKSPGLSNLLVGMNEIDSTIQRYETEETHTSFDVMPIGDIPPNPAELLSSNRMVELMTSLKNYYDYIFIDLPPICVVTDALIVSRVADGMIVVVRQDYSRTDALKDATKQLEFAEANIIGFVFNGASQSGKSYKRYSRAGKYYSRYYSRYYNRYYSRYYSSRYYTYKTSDYLEDNRKANKK